MSARTFLKSPVGTTLLLAVVWQLCFFFIGWFLSPQQGPLGHLSHWDAGWYLHITQLHYGTAGNPAAPAFYPLFPLVVSFIHIISFGLVSPLAAALIINTLALWAALYALFGTLKHFKVSRSAQWIGVLAFLAFPSAFFMSVFYSEALFIALAFWSYYFALQKKWWLVGISLAILTAARLPSLLFVALCGLEYLRVYHWSIKKALNKNLLWFLLAPLGFIAYSLYLLVVRGDFLAMFHAYSATSDWKYQHFNPNIFATLYETIANSAHALAQHQFNYELFINSALPLITLVALVTASIYVLVKLRRDGIPLFVFGMLSVVLFTINSNVVSVHRYILACVVIYCALALFCNQRRGWTITALVGIIASFALQLFLYGKFVSDVFAG